MFNNTYKSTHNIREQIIFAYYYYIGVKIILYGIAHVFSGKLRYNPFLQIIKKKPCGTCKSELHYM